MRLKRSALEPCPNCHERRYLDRKLLPGGERWVDQHAIECVWCGIRCIYAPSEAEAIAAWDEFAKRGIGVE